MNSPLLKNLLLIILGRIHMRADDVLLARARRMATGKRAETAQLFAL